VNVGVLGYYGYGNAGDEIIFDTLRHFLEPHRLFPIQIPFRYSEESIERLNNFDFLILGGGGLFQKAPLSPFDSFDRWMSRLKVPIGVLGLGVERLDPQFEAATHQLCERATFFVVRDEESQRLVGHPKVQVAPDLTFYRPRRAEIGQRAVDGILCGVNLRPIHAGVSDWMDAVQALPCRKRAVLLSTHPAMGERETLLVIDPECPDHFSVDAYADLDLMVVTAFHAAVFAIQNGVPVIAINYNPKVRRLMEAVGLVDYVLEWQEWGYLRPCYEQVLRNRDGIRRQMLDHTSWAETELQELLQRVRQEIEKVGDAALTVRSSERGSPMVSIIVLGSDSSQESLATTVHSCLDQSHANVEVLWTGSSDEWSHLVQTLPADGRMRPLGAEERDTGQAVAVLGSAIGSYVTWLRAGDWLVADAIATLVGALEARPVAALAYADHYVAHSGIIEYKVSAGDGRATDSSPFSEPCCLIRRDGSEQLLAPKPLNRWRRTEAARNSVYVPHGLLYRPATEGELHMYRSALAYGRGEMPTAQRHLSRALEKEPSLSGTRGQGVVALLEAVARQASAVDRPEEYVDLVFGNLPEDAKRFRLLKRRLRARLAMARLYAANSCRDWAGVLQAARHAIPDDPSWLRNRGVWVILLRATLAMILPGWLASRSEVRLRGRRPSSQDAD